MPSTSFQSIDLAAATSVTVPSEFGQIDRSALLDAAAGGQPVLSFVRSLLAESTGDESALAAIRQVCPEPGYVVPTLIALLADENVAVRNNAASLRRRIHIFGTPKYRDFEDCFIDLAFDPHQQQQNDWMIPIVDHEYCLTCLQRNVRCHFPNSGMIWEDIVEDAKTELVLKFQVKPTLGFKPAMYKGFGSCWKSVFRSVVSTAAALQREKRHTRKNEIIPHTNEAVGRIAAPPVDGFCDDYVRLYTALEQLDAKEREVVQRRYMLGFKQHEVAEHMGISQNKVKTIQDRAKRQLRRLLVTHHVD